MKLAIVCPGAVPRTPGGVDRLLEGLAPALREHYPTDLITIPVDERSAEGVLRGYYDFYNLDLSAYDAIISVKSPAYMVRHPRHVVYLTHRMRVFYDLYEPRDEAHERLRALIHFMDDYGLSTERVGRIFTVGDTVAKRLAKWGGHKATGLRHPSTFVPVQSIAPPIEFKPYFFAPGRLHVWKRFDLLIRAMRAAKCDARLVVAGSGPDEAALRELAAGDERIEFTGYIDEARLAELYANARATLFAPINEDLGMVTLESFQSGVPVLTASDSGEPALIVQDGETGFIAAPDPEALAEKLDWLAGHPAEAQRMGEAGRSWAQRVTWDSVTAPILQAIAAMPARELNSRPTVNGAYPQAGPKSGPHSSIVAGGETHETTDSRNWPAGNQDQSKSLKDDRIRLLVLDNQIIDPPVGGGRLRIWELYRHLPDDFITTYLGAFDYPGPAPRDQWMAPNFREILVPLSTIHFRRHELWRRLTRGDATIDVTMPLLVKRGTPRYARRLAELAPAADVILCAHPWMFPTALRWRDEAYPEAAINAAPPLVYDSQNCEAVVKGSLLARTAAGRHLARVVEKTEAIAVRRAALTLACSPADAEEFARRYGVSPRRILEAANGVDCERLRPASPGERTAARRALGLDIQSPAALFIGSDYQPNIDAVDFLAREAAPRNPSLTILVAGGAGPAWQRTHHAAAPPNLRLLGTVSAEVMGDLLRAADLGLNPMEQGSGTNIKMLDYMASGLAIVTTPTGARGIAGRNGEHWREASRAVFAGAVAELVRDAGQRERVGLAARKLAEERYDWRAISARLAEALRALHAQRMGAVRMADFHARAGVA